MSRLVTVMGKRPTEWADLLEFNKGQIVYPDTKLNLVKGPDDITMRVVDLACPIGKGTTGIDCGSTSYGENHHSQRNCRVVNTKSSRYSFGCTLWWMSVQKR